MESTFWIKGSNQSERYIEKKGNKKPENPLKSRLSGILRIS